jgi:hypothetical protein
MKKFIVLLLLFPFFQLNAQHQHDSELGKVVGINDLLIGFDEDAALQLMNEKNISESEKVGYMRYLKIAYIKKKSS